LRQPHGEREYRGEPRVAEDKAALAVEHAKALRHMPQSRLQLKIQAADGLTGTVKRVPPIGTARRVEHGRCLECAVARIAEGEAPDMARPCAAASKPPDARQPNDQRQNRQFPNVLAFQVGKHERHDGST
jgi:hypothetical protein